MKIPSFVKFIYYFTVRLIIVLSVLGFIIFLLWGVLYLLFIR